MISKKLSLNKVCIILATTILLLSVIMFSVLYILTKEMSVVFCSMAFCLLFLLCVTVFVILIRRKLTLFSEILCCTLDEMMNGKIDISQVAEEENLFYKINHRLVRLYEVMQESKNSVASERADLQELISDISHQVKTPIANLKMVNATLLEQEVPSDKQREFLLASGTQLGYRGEQEQLFDENFINELNLIEGVGNISLQREQTIIPEYSEDMFYSYILDKYQSQGMEAPGADYYEQYSNRFYTQLVSIDAEKLKDYIVENGMDYEGFYNGDYGLLVTDKPELFPSDMTLRFQCGQISDFEAIAGGDILELPINGFLPSSYYGGLSTDAPYIFVSDAGMERISPDAYISQLGIDVNSANEKQVVSAVRELCNQESSISLTSKAELSEGLHSAKITLYTLGGGIAFVLAFIGIINFANIMFTNIEARKHELSVMESIGMTKKQCRRMLQMEGLWYAIISLALCLTGGNGLLILAFQAFKGIVEYAAFSYPVWMLFIIIIVLTAFCWLVPSLFVNRMMIKSTVERLRQN